eukprot:SAG11_NODE_708_length_7648_cov_3.486687_1_plen_343_part_00
MIKSIADDFWREIRELWATFPASAAKILMLDANGRMARGKGVGEGSVTGKWSMYSGSDNGLRAMLRQFCEDEELVAISTKFQPKRRRGGVGTFQPYERASKKVTAQIDYIVCSRRYATSCQMVRARWGPAERRWKLASGQRKDHATLVMKWRMRMSVTKLVEQPDIFVLQTADGAATAAEVWRTAWQNNVPAFVAARPKERASMEASSISVRGSSQPRVQATISTVVGGRASRDGVISTAGPRRVPVGAEGQYCGYSCLSKKWWDLGCMGRWDYEMATEDWDHTHNVLRQDYDLNYTIGWGVTDARPGQPSASSKAPAPPLPPPSSPPSLAETSPWRVVHCL